MTGYKSAARTSPERPNWFECPAGTVCGPCRQKMLENVDYAMGRYADPDGRGSEDEIIRRSDFVAIGRTPWAGNDAGDRYMQCDNCGEQYGPDA